MSGTSRSTIKEFLIGLGVDVHQNDVREFFTTIDGMTKAAGRLVLSLQAAAAAIKAAVIATAAAMEQLYYISQRSGAAVETLKAFEYAFRQVGLSAGDAAGALESLASAIRTNPGNEALLRHLGMATRDLKGNLRDTVAIEGDLLERLRKMPFYIAAQYAEMFGISSRTLYQLLQNMDQVKLREQEWRDMARAIGLNLADATKTGLEFMRSLRSLGEVIELMWIKVSTAIEARLKPELDNLKKWLLDNSDVITASLIEMANTVLDWAEKITKFLLDHGKDILAVFKEMAGGVQLIIQDLNPLFDLLAKLTGQTDKWRIVFEAIADIILYRMFGPLGLVYGLLTQLITLMESHGITPKSLVPNRDTYQNIPTIPEMTDRFLHLFGLGSGGGQAALGAPGVQKQSGTGPIPDAATAAIPAALFRFLENTRGLPRGTLDAVWSAESTRGRNTRSSADAEGDFQFMPGTARRYGVDNPYDLKQAARGASDYLRDLMQMFHGNLAQAVAGYNWGEANVMKDIQQFGERWREHLPRETSDYIAKIERMMQTQGNQAPSAPLGAGAPVTTNNGGDKNVTIHNNNNVTVQPGGTGTETGHNVRRSLEQANASMVRDFRTAVLV